MHSGKTQIRISLLVVFIIALGTTLISLSYLNQMKHSIDQIAYQDARVTQLGESISRQMLEARREEKNFIIYLDTLYLNNTKQIITGLRNHIQANRVGSPVVVATLDSIQTLLERYEVLVMGMAEIYQKDPNTFYKLQSQLLDYENSLKNLATRKKLPEEELVSWLSTLNITLVSANAKISAGKARHFAELKSISESVVALSQEIAEQAKVSMEKHTEEGLKYSIRAQRNTLTLIFISGLMIVALIIRFPKRIFSPYDRFIKALQAVSLGGKYPVMPHATADNEIGALSRAISAALHDCIVQSDLKTVKIKSIQRMYRRLMDELDEAIFILDPDLIILHMNSRARGWFAKNTDTIQKISDVPVLWKDLQATLAQIERSGRTEVKLSSQGLLIPRKQASVIPIIKEGGLLEYVVLIIQ